MNSTELLRTFREEVNDTAEPPLWSDAFVWGAMDDAQTKFWQRVRGIADAATTATCQLSLVAGTEWYALHPKVLRVRSARGALGRPLSVVGYAKATDQGARFDGATGTPRWLIDGETDGQLRAYPVPSADETVTLSVFRLPLTSIDGDSQTLELPDEHHRCLLLWMKARAYAVPDIEAYDPRKAEGFERSFYAYCGEAASELERRRRPAGTVQYGGI